MLLVRTKSGKKFVLFSHTLYTARCDSIKTRYEGVERKLRVAQGRVKPDPKTKVKWVLGQKPTAAVSFRVSILW